MKLKRLTEPGSESTELERSLLRADVKPVPGAAEQELVWGRLLTSLLPPVGPGGGGGTAGGHDSGGRVRDPAPGSEGVPLGKTPRTGLAARVADKSRGLVTLLVNHGIGFGVGVAAATTFFVLKGAFEREAPAPATPAPTAVRSMAPSRGGGPRTTNDAPAAARSGPGAVSIDQLELEAKGPAEVPKARRAHGADATPAALDSQAHGTLHSRLREEAALLRRAREALAANDLEGAEQALADSRRSFPEPVLGQEREALTIELMRRKGLASEAASLARDFASKYPHSPQSRQVERALSGAEEGK